MGLRVHFPLRLSPRPHPEETAAEVVLPRIEPGPQQTTTSYWVRPAAPAAAPKTNNLTPLVSFFNQKQQENKQT